MRPWVLGHAAWDPTSPYDSGDVRVASARKQVSASRTTTLSVLISPGHTHRYLTLPDHGCRVYPRGETSPSASSGSVPDAPRAAGRYPPSAPPPVPPTNAQHRTPRCLGIAPHLHQPTRHYGVLVAKLRAGSRFATPCRTAHENADQVPPSLSHVIRAGVSEPILTLLDVYQWPVPFLLYVSLQNQGPFPTRALPRFSGSTDPSATLTARPAPHGVSVRPVLATGRASRVATSFIFHACQCQYPGGYSLVLVSFTSQTAIGLPPVDERVGFRIAVFEACSAFTRVPACMVAETPKASLVHQSASVHVVTSINRPGCSQPERQVLSGIRTRKKEAPYHGAHLHPAAGCPRCWSHKRELGPSLIRAQRPVLFG